MRITAGFSTRNDEGAWWTVNLLLEHHGHLFGDAGEIVIIDDSPRDSAFARELEGHVRGAPGVRYVRAVGPESSCLYKDRLFREARGDVVMCCDSHVYFRSFAIDALLSHLETRDNERDLVVGMCGIGAWKDMGSNQMLYSTEDYDLPRQNSAEVYNGVVMRGGSAGVWVTDRRARESEPFEVMQQGTGAFAMRREHWVRFHESFWGHGGNETYLMERVREEGGRVMFVPGFQWVHRFYRPGGPPYAVNWPCRVTNYLQTAVTLNRSDLYDAVVGHFSKVCPATLNRILPDFARPCGRHEAQLEALGLKGEGGSLPRPALEFLRRHVRPEMRTLEFGSGLSTLVFRDAGSEHTALESDRQWAERVGLPTTPTRDTGWYDFTPQSSYDVILIDGPLAKKGDVRLRCPRSMGRALRPRGVMIVDDTHRTAESRLAAEIGTECNLRRRRIGHGKRSFDMLRRD